MSRILENLAKLCCVLFLGIREKLSCCVYPREVRFSQKYTFILFNYTWISKRKSTKRMLSMWTPQLPKVRQRFTRKKYFVLFGIFWKKKFCIHTFSAIAAVVELGHVYLVTRVREVQAGEHGGRVQGKWLSVQKMHQGDLTADWDRRCASRVWMWPKVPSVDGTVEKNGIALISRGQPGSAGATTAEIARGLCWGSGFKPIASKNRVYSVEVNNIKVSANLDSFLLFN